MEEQENGRPRKFSDVDIMRMYAMCCKGKTYREVAKKFRCHYQTLSYRFKLLNLTKKWKRHKPVSEDRRFK